MRGDTGPTGEPECDSAEQKRREPLKHATHKEKGELSAWHWTKEVLFLCVVLCVTLVFLVPVFFSLVAASHAIRAASACRSRIGSCLRRVRYGVDVDVDE